MQYGSLQNKMQGEGPRPGETDFEWTVGAGATTLHWTDRTAHTVVEVVSDKEIKLRECKAIFKAGSMGTQVERYEEQPDAPLVTAKLGKAGWRTVNPATGRYGVKAGYRVVPGRNAYHDPSF